jgi:tetratricopeptide (TPR) repeat protein
VGKTQLALEYAYRYGGAYDVVWWLRAEEPATLALDYAALAEPLALPEAALQDEPTRIAAVRRWLEHHDRWLLIFDNAPEPAAVHPYLPRSPLGQILITSRHRGWGGTARALSVPMLSRDAAVEFLLHRTQQTDAHSAAALATELGDLPIALAQAAGYITVTGITLAGYLARWRTHRQELLRRGHEGLDYPATVATTWELAFHALEETQPAATALLCLCAYLAPEAIPQALLRDNREALPEHLGAAVADDLTWDEVLAALRHYALVDSTEERLAVHRLVQAVTRDRLSVEGQAHWARIAVQLIAKALPPGNPASEPQTWPPYARLVPHALAAANQRESERSAPEVTAFLFNQVGLYLRARAQYAEAQSACRRALAIQEKVLGPEHPDTAWSLVSLGVLLRAQGDLAGARLYCERALAIREKVLGPEHPDTAWSLNYLGGLLRAQGDLAGARAAFERSLYIYQSRLGEAHPSTQTVRGNLDALESEA